MRFAERDLFAILFKDGICQANQTRPRHRPQKLFELVPCQR